MTYSEAREKGIEFTSLDSVYINALHVDSTLAAFAGREDEFWTVYKNFLGTLGDFLDEKDFIWGMEIKGVVRI